MKKRLLLFLLCTAMLAGTLFSCAHAHTYAEAWSSSAESHWKADTCGHGTKTDEGYHSFDPQLVCKVCGYAEKSGAFSVAQLINSTPDEEILLYGL